MAAQITPTAHPVLSGVERPFFDYWLENVVDVDDPHLQRWMDYEEGAVERAAERTEFVEQYVPVAGKRILEIGCQNGAWLISLARNGADAVGIDVVAEAVDAAAVRAKCWDVEIDARVGDACALDFDDESFDVVTSNDVIEHVPDKVAMVREVMRVLKPGGIAIVSAPQRFSLKHLKSDPHYNYAGVSVFPASVVTWYLTKIRNESVYEVETLPTGFGVRKLFRNHDGIVLAPVDDTDSSPRSSRDQASAALKKATDELRQGFTVVVRKP